MCHISADQKTHPQRKHNESDRRESLTESPRRRVSCLDDFCTRLSVVHQKPTHTTATTSIKLIINIDKLASRWSTRAHTHIHTHTQVVHINNNSHTQHTANMDDSFGNLFNQLNLDKQTSDKVLKIYKKVGEKFLVEGNKDHWMACAIYAIANKNAASTRSNPSPAGGVSLTQLLRASSLSLADFLSLMDKWTKMTDQGSDIRPKIAHLERNFNVSAVVFRKYKEIFPEIFKPIDAKVKSEPSQSARAATQPQHERHNRTRKSLANARSNYEVTSADIYYFCWTLYINIKTTRPAISEDLVNSYHLLLACIDFCYSNALVSRFAHDVINPKFRGLPADFHSDDYKMMNNTKQPMCILNVLCNDWDGIVVDAKGIREHWLKPYIKELINEKVLTVSSTNDPPNTYLGIFDACNFESNMSKLTKKHDLAMMSIGDFDERIFLSETAHKELGAPVNDLEDLKRLINERDSSNNSSPTKSTANNQNDRSAQLNQAAADLDKQKPSLENGGRFVPQTPLTNRNYLANKAVHPSSPVANATRKVGDLYRLLAECTGEPTSSLEDVFKLCTNNPRESIMERTSQMVEKFVIAYTSDQDEKQAIDLARKRADLGGKLYFKLLEAIIVREQKRLPTDKIGDLLSSLLCHEIFHISLFACCIEIVLASHNAKRLFPWVLDLYKDFGTDTLYPFLFYKVIELVIREEDRLSRDIVKHLATIEEKVLDSMAWESDSPLWTAIAANGSIPSCQDVVLPPTNTAQNPFEMSPLSSLRRHEGFHSPMPVSNRYSVTTPIEGGARRRLFDGGLSGDSGHLTGSVQAASGPQIVQVVVPQKTETGEVKYIIVNASTLDASNQSVASATAAAAMHRHQDLDHTPTPIRPAVKSNPVNLFFRKVYYLAQVRFRDLWTRLSISSIDLQRKIWTLFENQIRNHTNLLRDRHLDQMIMCATYAVIKVCMTERNTSTFFQEIMRAYRFQPQANIEVYKNVLLAKPSLKLLDEGAKSTSTTPTSNIVVGVTTRSPRRTASYHNSPVKNVIGNNSQSSTSSPNQLPERGDLIQFYNQVYVPQVKKIMVKIVHPDNSLSLSPLPRMNTNPISPWRRVSQQHSVYVSPLKCNSLPASPGRQLTYSFHKSPAKDLQTINNMINRQRAACKRILQDDDGENTKRHCISHEASKRIIDLMNDRRSSK